MDSRDSIRDDEAMHCERHSSQIALSLMAMSTFLGGLTSQDQEAAVVAWLKEHAIPIATPEAGRGFADLQPLRRIIGDARIVSLGESTHGSREIFQMKHRMFEFLVEELGFRVFAIEASYPDCVAINDFVLHGKGDAASALHGQRFWTWDTEEVLTLIRWMRAYNRDATNTTKLRFYGFDMQSPAPALEQAIEALELVDPTGATALAKRLSPLRDRMIFRTYATLPEKTRSGLTAAAKELVKQFDEFSDPLTAKVGRTRYSRARQHAVVVAQGEELIRSSSSTAPSMGWPRAQQLIRTGGETVRSLRTYLGSHQVKRPSGVDLVLARIAAKPQHVTNTYMGELSAADRLRWDGAARSLQNHLEVHREQYVKLSSDRAWSKACEEAKTLTQFLGLCREFVEIQSRRAALGNVRDRCMASNVAWILDTAAPGEKIVLWGHNTHVGRKPAKPGMGWMGAELERKFGDDHVVFGFSFDQGSFQAMNKGLREHTVGHAMSGSVDRVFSAAGIPMFIVDLAQAPQSGRVAAWLRASHPMRSIGAVFSTATEQEHYRATVLLDHYDAVVFLAETTRARPNPLTRTRLSPRK